jgi:HlyD family secretion protein
MEEVMKRGWVLLFAITLLGVSGCRSTSANSEGTLFVSGRIDGDSVDLSSKRPGRVVEIKVREGDSVQKGQLLAVLASDQDEARRDEQMARIVADQRTMARLQRQLKTYQERIRRAQIYEEQSQMDAPAQVQAAEANLASSKADLTRSEAELRQSQIDAERYFPLVKKGAVSAQVSEQYTTKLRIAEADVEANRKKVAAADAALQSARSGLENPRIKEADRLTLQRETDEVKEQIAAAQADVKAAEAELRRIEADLNDLNIVAPIAGTILTRSAEPGRVIASGQTILTMVDLSKLYLRGFIPEGNVGDVKVGQAAEVYLDSRPNDAISAEVIRIDPQVMFTPENTYFKEDRVKQVMGVKLGLHDGYGLAKPGMPADGTILIGRRR